MPRPKVMYDQLHEQERCVINISHGRWICTLPSSHPFTYQGQAVYLAIVHVGV